MQQKNLNDHLAPPRMLLRTPKGCEHPWLGTPALIALFLCKYCNFLHLSLKIGTSTLVCHSSGIPFPFNSRLQSSTITLAPASPPADIMSGRTSKDPAAFPGFITFIAVAISSRVTFLLGPSTIDLFFIFLVIHLWKPRFLPIKRERHCAAMPFGGGAIFLYLPKYATAYK